MRIQEYVILLAALAMPSAVLAADSSKPSPDKPQSQVGAPRSPWSAFIVGGGMMMPDFPGSKDYKYMPFVMARLAYSGYYIEVMGPRAKINVIPSGMFEAGPMVSYDGGRDDGVENGRVKLLPKVKSTIEAGGFGKVNFKNLALEGDSLSFGIEFAKAFAGHKGYTFSLQTAYGMQFNRALFMSIDGKMSMNDKNYMNAYFGVDPVGAITTGLPTYAASAGISKAELGLNARYAFTPNWGLTGRAAYGRLVGEAAKSPIVLQEGSKNQFSVGLGVLYRF